MPLLRTRLQLRTGALAYADAEFDRNVSTTLVNTWINDAHAELWRAKVDAAPDVFAIRDTTTLVTTSGTQNYDLPDDFMQVRRVTRLVGSIEEPLLAVMPMAELDFSQYGGSYATHFRVIGGGATGAAQIWLLPNPGSATYVLWYVQSPQDLADDTDEIDCTRGEDQFIMAAVAARIATRQEKDPSLFLLKQAEAKDSITKALAVLATGTVARIADVRFNTRHPRRYPLP